MGEPINVYRIFVGKPERKSPLARSRCRWENNVKMNVWETGWDGVNCVYLA